VLPANVSLGLLLGLVALWECGDFVRWPRPVVYAATAVGVLEILLDAHRSVWLSAVVIFGVLLVRLPGLEAKVRWISLCLLVALVVVVLSQGLGQNPLGIVAERGGAVLSGQDTTGLRIGMWKAAEPLFARSPVLGQGLGRYWDLFLPQLGYAVLVFPHSLYVMTLVDLGVVGLLACAWLWIRAWRRCTAVPHAGPGAAGLTARRFKYASLGLAALAAIAAFGVAYGLEDRAVLLAGVCVAGAMLAPACEAPAERRGD
jgi:O-antigen ligase